MKNLCALLRSDLRDAAVESGHVVKEGKGRVGQRGRSGRHAHTVCWSLSPV